MKKFWVPLGYHFGYHSVPKVCLWMWKISKKSIFCFKKFAIMVPKMVPQWYPKCLMVPKWYPKWYPSGTQTPWHIFSNDDFSSFFKFKKWPHDYFGHNFGYHRKFLGTIDIFFGKHTMSAIWEKKGGRYLAIFIYLAWFSWFFTRSMIFTCGTLCIFWVP